MQSALEILLPRLHGSWSGITSQELVGFVTPKLIESRSLGELAALLYDKQLRVAYHIEPISGLPLMGDLAPFALLNIFARADYHIDLVVGDFTAPLLGVELADTPAWLQLVGSFFDLSHLSLHRNSGWLSEVTLEDFFGVLGQMPLASVQAVDRTMTVAEAYYEVFRGLDLVYLDSDVEIGIQIAGRVLKQGLAVARLQRDRSMAALIMPMLDDSLATLPIAAEVDELFGRVMSVPDETLLGLFRLLMPIHVRELEMLQAFMTAQPLEAKKQLATLIVAGKLKSLDQAWQVRGEFERRFSRRSFTEQDFIETVVVSGCGIVAALVATGLFRSGSEIRRLIADGAVRMAYQPDRILTQDQLVDQVLELKVGKRRLIRLIPQIEAR